MIPITVHVPERRVEDFYVRFGEFISAAPSPEVPLRLESGIVPSWVQSDRASAMTNALWAEISFQGHAVLKHMARETKNETKLFRPGDIANAMNHPKGNSGIAGILGGVGKAIRRADLPMYTTPTGGTWHYIWEWDGESYSMTPEVARLLRKAAIGPAR